MIDKDNELNFILQEARESYQKRIDELKQSLKSAYESTEEKEFKMDLEKFSPFKSQLEPSDSLRYSTSFKPLSKPSDENFKVRNAVSGDLNYNLRYLSSQSDYQQENNTEIHEEVKNLTNHIVRLEENLNRWKKSYDEAENTNTELRNRLKDSAIQITKLTQENLKNKETRNESAHKDMQNMRLHYKKKIGVMKEQLVKRDSEKQLLVNEIDVYRIREKDLKKVCEAQVKEICDEYVKNIKNAGNIHNEELNNIKNTYESINEAKCNGLIEEINNLRNQLREYEKNFKGYKDAIETLRTSKENSDKILSEKDQILINQSKEYESILKTYKEKFDSLVSLKDSQEKTIRESEEAIRDLQQSYKKLRSDYELQITNLKEENSSKLSQIGKITEEIDKQNKTNIKLKLESQVQVESERIKNTNLEAKYSMIEANYSELSHTHQNLLHKVHILETQLHQQPIEYQKKYEYEINRYHERIRSLENELKALYAENSSQAKEMEALKTLCAEIEVNQNQALKFLQQNHEENIREMKRIDRYEYLQLSDAHENNKQILKQAEQTINDLEVKLELSNRRENELNKNIKALETQRKTSEDLINDLKFQINSLSNQRQKSSILKKKSFESIKMKALNLKESHKSIIKIFQEKNLEFEYFLQKTGTILLKSIFESTDLIKKNESDNSLRIQEDLVLVSFDLKKAHERIENLEKSLKKYQIVVNQLEQDKSNLIKLIESKDHDRGKSSSQPILRQLLSGVSYLEKSIEEGYTDLAYQIKALKDAFKEENDHTSRLASANLDQAKKSTEYYRDKLIKLQSEKALELNKSQQELFSLEQRLAQVLQGIKEQRG